MKPRKQCVPATTRPWLCDILAIDPGRTSGWALFQCGIYTASGECNAMLEAERIVELMLPRSNHPARFAIELHQQGDKVGDERMTPRTLIGLSETTGAWKSALLRRGVSERHIVRVLVPTWRGRVTTAARGTRKEAHQSRELMTASWVSGQRITKPNEAAAICIGHWACRAGEIGRTLPKRVQRQFGMEGLL